MQIDLLIVRQPPMSRPLSCGQDILRYAYSVVLNRNDEIKPIEVNPDVYPLCSRVTSRIPKRFPSNLQNVIAYFR